MYATYLLTRMDRTVVAFHLLLSSCAFALSIFVSRPVGNMIVLLSYGLFFIVAVVSNSDLHSGTLSEITIPFHADSALFYPAVLIWGVFVVGFVRSPSPDAFLRLGAFTVLSAITLFVIPAVVSREQAFRSIGILGAVGVIIALPSLIWPDYSVFGVDIARTLNGQRTEFTLGVISRTPLSFFDGISYFRVLTTVGAVCAGALFVKNRDLWMAVACLLNVFGVFLGLGRATILGLVTAATLAVVYRVAGSKALAGVTVVGSFCAIGAFVVATGLFPGPTSTLQSILGKRIGYWTASYGAFIQRPFVGWGLADTTTIVSEFYPRGTLTGVHNSYLRMFVIGGVVGGVSYLLLSGSALVVAFRSVRESVPLALSAYCLVICILVIQIFTGGTIFGTNLSSVLWALTIGYAQSDAATID